MEKFNLKSLVRPSIATLKPYSSARDEFEDASGSENIMVFIDANENPYDNGLNRYPDPQQRKLKELLAKQKALGTQQILLGNGSDEVLDLLVRAFCEPKRDSVITLPPTYGMYDVLANINDIQNKEVLLSREFKPNVDAILDAVEAHTKIIFLCSPNNPTGNSFPEESIFKLLENFNGLVVIDEAYIDFSEQQSWIRNLDDFPNLVITQTFSKAYGLASIRLGICYASAEIIKILNKIKPPYNVNGLTQEAAIKRLGKKEKVRKEIKKIIKNRGKLVNALQKISFIRHIYPTDANFILVKVDNAGERYNQLLRKGIVTRNRSTQPLCDNTLRLTVGAASENDHLIKTLKAMQ